jgi:glycine oxidase
MSIQIGILGAGVLGRVLALRLDSLGCNVTLFDENRSDGAGSSSYVAAGMLAPYCELETADNLIFDLGVASLELWPKILQEFETPPFFRRRGSLVVTHTEDLPDLELLRKKVAKKVGGQNGFQDVSAVSIFALEPEIDRKISNGIFFKNEGHISSRDFLVASAVEFHRRKIQCFFETCATASQSGKISCSAGDFQFDHVIDCRGIRARADMTSLRAIRGELIRVYAPDVHLGRPVRLIHPRYPLYIVPLPNKQFVIGATQIESDDLGPITVQSTLELLTAAFSVLPGFAEARIAETSVGLRPAFPTHSPRVQIRNRLLRVNGLYRHGFLIAPKLSEIIGDFILNEKGSLNEFSD